MNKRGEGFEIGSAWPIILTEAMVITILVILFAFATSAYKESLSAEPSSLVIERLSLRFATAPECFALQDSQTKRTIHSTIDLNKFTIDQMNKCYNTKEQGGLRAYNFRLVLENQEKEITTDSYAKNDAVKKTIFQDVYVKTSSGFIKDQLIIYVQEPIR